eukprot:1188361-Prorocentrum_minimum.AAC.3
MNNCIRSVYPEVKNSNAHCYSGEGGCAVLRFMINPDSSLLQQGNCETGPSSRPLVLSGAPTCQVAPPSEEVRAEA